jgi:NNP family nitrate/nitrite transporter-like MFS transporter
VRTDARKDGDLPTLVACFMHFDLSFMLWVLVGALGVFISSSLGLSPAQKGWMVAIPILSGSLLRIPMGHLSDRIGGRRTGILLLAFLFLPLAVGWHGAESFSGIVATGIMLGVGGASFAVALPLASRWYPPERQGLAMGIAAAGNSGTVITNLVAPRLAIAVGWHAVFGLAMLPLAAVLLAFILLAKDAPSQARASPAGPPAASLLREPDLWWLCGFYAVTFGGYVGLSSFLPIFLRDQYGVTPLQAGYLTAAAAFAGSLARPIGGIVADRVGGVRLLAIVLVVVSGAYALASRLPPLALMAAALALGMVALGMGNGAVFQIVPQRFRRQIGAATGIVGALGGLGGFALPTLLGTLKQTTGSFGAGFLALALVALAAAGVLRGLSSARVGWPAALGAGGAGGAGAEG